MQRKTGQRLKSPLPAPSCRAVDSSSVAFAVVFSLSVLFTLWLAGQPWLLERRRARLRARPFPAEWREILKRRVPYFRRLPADLQLQLKQHIQVFLAEKPFIG